MKLTQITHTILLLFILCFSAFAQDLIGGAVFYHRDQGGGNGASYGLYGQATKTIYDKNVRVQGVADVEIGKQLKVYRSQFGGFGRTNLLGRVWRGRFGLEAGANLSGIWFQDTPGSDDGYAKYGWRPVGGVIAELGKNKFSVTANYRYIFKRPLLAQKNELGDFPNRYIDGWSSGQRGSLQFVLPFDEKSKWRYFITFAGGRYVYRRNPGVYGEVPGSVNHINNTVEILWGVARVR